MNVASLELCRELYELSGWWTDEPDGFTWLKDDINSSGKWELICNHSFQPMPSVLYRKGEKAYPAYDLGYLWRKLPPSIKVELAKRVYYEDDDHWSVDLTAWYGDDFYWTDDFDSAENALASLLIRIWKDKDVEIS